jgi:RHS repeat-associated protein
LTIFLGLNRHRNLKQQSSVLSRKRPMIVAARALLCIAIVLLISLTPKPAVAGWGSTLSDGCNTSCSTPQQVCNYWGNFYGGGCLSVGPPVYSNTGRMIGMVIKMGYLVIEPVITGEADTFCDAPYVKDALAPNGCSLAVSVPVKQLGCGCSGQEITGNPITVNIGNKFETAVDFETQGQDQLAFVRYYNSQDPQASAMGYGWRSNFDRGFLQTSPSTVLFTRPDGSTYSFTNSSGGWAPTDTDVNAQLTSLGASGWLLTDQNDTVETYTVAGQLSSIKTRSGYQQTLTYDTNGNLASVTDSFGRTLTFSVINGVIQGMTDPDGKVYTYNYANLVTLASQLVSVTFPGSNSPTVQYLYENPSYPYALTGVIDEKGARYASWTYDSNLRAISSQHAGGADATTLSYSLDDSGVGTVTTTNALGKQKTYSLGLVAGVGKILSVTGLASAHTGTTSESFTYDANGYVASHTDNNGNVTKYSNDSRGHIVSETDAFGSPVARTITTTWDTTFNLPTERVEPNLTTQYTYSSGLLTQKTEIDTNSATVPYSTNGTTRSWGYTYYPNGLLHTVDGPLAGVSDTETYAYDTHGCVASFADALGHTSTITSTNGRCEPLSSTDSNEIVSNFTYDDRGRLTAVTVNPGANQSRTTFSYDPAGNLTTVTFPDSSTLSYAYDDAHRLTSVTNNFGETITYTLDALGNRSTTVIKSASAVITKQQSATFDELGRLMASIGAAVQTTSFAYDSDSNTIAVTDPRGKVYGQTFDALNRLSRQTNPDAARTSIVYDSSDNPISVTDARSLATTYVRDGFGNVIQRTSPDTGTDTFWYDANNNVVKKIDARDIETDFTYDATSRVLTKKFPTAPAENVSFGYDDTSGGNHGIGRLTSVNDESGSTQSFFDALGRVTSQSRVVSGQSFNISYTYDAAGHILTETYPSGRIVSYARDALGRVLDISTSQNASATPVSIVASATYRPFGPLSGFTFGNGLAASFAFDQDYQPTGIVTSNSTTAIQNITNQFDPSGNITAISDNLAGSRSQVLTYDDLNRVASASGAYGAQSYTYDSVGNRLSRTANGLAEGYTYSMTSNRLASVTFADGNVRSLSYEASGQLSEDGRDAGHIYTFATNSDGRNAGAYLNGAVIAQYLYNAFGQRVQKVAGGVTTRMAFDLDGHLLEEADGSGAVQRDYIWLDDMPVALAAYAGLTPTLYYIHTDHSGTPRKMTDGSANIVWDNLSDPFGNSMATRGTNWGAANWGVFNWASVMLSLSNLRFPGQYFDSETGYSQNGYRDYDSSIGRYVQSDPIGLSGGVNTYAYVNGNPIRYVDPLGLAPRGTEVLGTRRCNSVEAQQCRAQCGNRGVDRCSVRITRVINGVSGNGDRGYTTNRDVLCSCNDEDSNCPTNEESAFDKFMRGLRRPVIDNPNDAGSPEIDDESGNTSASRAFSPVPVGAGLPRLPTPVPVP